MISSHTSLPQEAKVVGADAKAEEKYRRLLAELKAFKFADYPQFAEEDFNVFNELQQDFAISARPGSNNYSKLAARHAALRLMEKLVNLQKALATWGSPQSGSDNVLDLLAASGYEAWKSGIDYARGILNAAQSNSVPYLYSFLTKNPSERRLEMKRLDSAAYTSSLLVGAYLSTFIDALDAMTNCFKPTRQALTTSLPNATASLQKVGKSVSVAAEAMDRILRLHEKHSSLSVLLCESNAFLGVGTLFLGLMCVMLGIVLAPITGPASIYCGALAGVACLAFGIKYLRDAWKQKNDLVDTPPLRDLYSNTQKPIGAAYKIAGFFSQTIEQSEQPSEIPVQSAARSPSV